MTGLQKLCKLYGGFRCGDVKWTWDYAQQQAVIDAELRADKERFKASEAARLRLRHGQITYRQ